MKTYRVVYVDAFTSVPFCGNPCAILPEASGLTDEDMQAIARETNLSETSFVLPSDRADFRVRYFTPRTELPFAGHPTIATAFMLVQEGFAPVTEPTTRIHLEFKMGVLPVDIQVTNRQPVNVVMTQQRPTFGESFPVREVAPGFNLGPSAFRDDVLPQVVSTGVPFLIAAVKGRATLGKIRMNREVLANLCDRAKVSAAFVFSVGGFDPATDVHARFFDPRGTTEDPFTGSAYGAAGAYIYRHGLKETRVLRVEQGHWIRRPGQGILEIIGTRDNIEGVKLGGMAVKVLDGKMEF